jgi:integrase
MLPLGEEIGRAISSEEERRLLDACGKSRSRSLLPLVILAIETGARFGTLRTLQWGNVDFAERTLKFGKDKTAAGSGRVIPLNQRAVATLQFWATSFPDRQPEHYVFPSELYGLAGEEGYLNGKSGPYRVDVTKPMLSWKTSWNTARRVAGVKCRLHDCRHTYVTRLLDAGVPITKVAKLVGWTPSTMVAMAGRYGHHGLDDLRSVVEAVSRQNHRYFRQGPRYFHRYRRTHRAKRFNKSFRMLVDADGIEPSTCRLRVECSAS